MKRWMMESDMYREWKDSVKDQKKNRMVQSMLEIVEKDNDNAYR